MCHPELRERHCEAGQKQSSGLFLASLRAAVLRRFGMTLYWRKYEFNKKTSKVILA